MRRFFVLCAALFCLAFTASAQDSGASFDAASPEADPAAPAPFIHPDRPAWQLGASFQYAHFSVLGQSFSNFGYQADVARYLNNSIGLEGATMEGFGHTGAGSSEVAKSLFLGGGVRSAVPTASRIEPWVHALVGLERLRFTQTGTLGANSGFAFVVGGGADYKIGEGRLYWRTQVDFIGAHIGSTIAPNVSVATGLILNF